MCKKTTDDEDAVYYRHLSMNFKEDNISIQTELCHGRRYDITLVNFFFILIITQYMLILHKRRNGGGGGRPPIIVHRGRISFGLPRMICLN